MAGEAPATERRGWLQLLARVFDADTFERLDRMGIGAGWTILDVGTGAGSVADWLARRTGLVGRVVATDVDTTHAAVEAPNVEVVRHDVLTDDFEPASFDLVHCRAVLVHLADPDLALRRMAGWLRPGGILFAQEPWVQGSFLPSDPVLDRVVGALGSDHLDGAFAGRLPAALRSAGLDDVEGDETRETCSGGTELAAFFRHTLAGAAVPLVARGELRRTDVAAMLARFDDPGWSARGWPRIAASGRAPFASSRRLRADAMRQG